ncbi:MAG TPA: hypothetical protein VFW00_01440 [Rhodocyclaceae bacterium]|nr:hypothetical protein [Rhodocyclaceae bacterium]
MSVINSMLRDLDERQRGPALAGATSGSASGLMALSGEIRATPPSSPRVRPGVLLGTLVLGAAITAGWYFYASPKPSRAPKPVSIEETPIVPIEHDNDIQSIPLAQQTASQETVAAAKQPAPVAEEPSPAAVDALLQMSSALSSEEEQSATSAIPPRKIAPNRKSAAPAKNIEAPSPLALAIASPAVAPSNIVVEQAVVPAQERLQSEVQRAADLQRRGSLAEAETVLRSVLDDDKSMVPARQALIVLLARQQREDEVRKLLQDGVALDPTQPLMVMQYARLLAGHNEWKAAADVLTPAATALARDPEFRALNGAVLQRLGNFKSSVEEYRAALHIAPDVGPWWVGLGLSLESDGRLAEARDAYQQARQHQTLTPDLQQFVDSKLAHLP